MTRPRRRKPLNPFQVENALKSPPVGIGGGFTVWNRWGERIACDAVIAVSMVCPTTYNDAREIFARLMTDGYVAGEGFYGPFFAHRLEATPPCP